MFFLNLYVCVSLYVCVCMSVILCLFIFIYYFYNISHLFHHILFDRFYEYFSVRAFVLVRMFILVYASY